MNKKGSIVDGIYITIIVLALFLGFTTAKIVWDKVTEDGNLQGNLNETTRLVNRYNTDFIPMYDSFFIFAILGSYISVFILAYFIRGTPAFLPIMVMVIIIGTVLAVFVSNAHNELMKQPIISETVSGWTMSNYLIEHLPSITFFYLIALSVIMLSLGETI